jgi:glycosyltransferase involved in cell wall biosynthesis
MSVIISTKDRPHYLEDCLKSIVAVSKNVHEIVVVDSSKNPTNQTAVRRIVAFYGGRYLYENRSGLSFARNLGVMATAHEFVAFVDDDFIMKDRWDAFLLDNLSNPGVACCTGRMLRYATDHASDLFEQSLSYDRGIEKRVFTRADISLVKQLKSVGLATRRWLGEQAPVPWSIGVGFFSLRKSVLADIGLFDESLGRGTPTQGGEEVDMFYRILKAGYKVVYEPRAVIYHNPPRSTLGAVCVAAYYAGLAERALTERHFGGDPYMALQFFGAFFFHVFAIIGLLRNWDPETASMTFARLRGFLKLHMDSEFTS